MTLSIELTEELAAKIARATAEEGMTSEQWVQRLIVRYLEKRGATAVEAAHLPDNQRNRLNRI